MRCRLPRSHGTSMHLIRRLRCLVPSLLVAVAIGDAARMPARRRPAHVTAELVADATALVPGHDGHARAASRDRAAAGTPTGAIRANPACRRRSPGGCRPAFAAGDIVWPAPRALPAGPLVNYGYEGEVFHLVPISVPADANAGGNAVARGPRGLARLQGNVHSGGRGSHARIARRRRRRRRRDGTTRWRRRARRCPRAAGRMAGKRRRLPDRRSRCS